MFEFNRCQSSKIADSSFLTKLFLSVQSGIANCHRQNKPVISALFLPAETTGFAHFSQKSDLTAVLLSGSGWLSSSLPALFEALILLLNPQNVCLGMSGFPVFLSGLSPLLLFPASVFTVLHIEKASCLLC